MAFLIRPIRESERTWAGELLCERWGSARIVTRGRLHQADQLPAFVVEMEGELVGLLTYHLEADACEIVSLDSLVKGQGIGRALLRQVEDVARTAGCQRLWLVTTNDNQQAIAFYERCDFTLIAVHQGAVNQARELKPEIPTHNQQGIPIEDEWEFERRL